MQPSIVDLPTQPMKNGASKRLTVERLQVQGATEIYIFFNNDFEAFAAQNAMDLQNLLGERLVQAQDILKRLSWHIDSMALFELLGKDFHRWWTRRYLL